MTTYTVTLSQVGMQGPKGANWRGTWAVGLDFIVNDVVHRDGSTYICTKQHTSAAENEPSAGVDEAIYWEAFTLSGSSAAAVEAADSADQAKQDAIATAADRVQTGLDVEAAQTARTGAETAETGAVTAQGLAESARDEAQAVSVTGSHFTSGGPVATASTANLTLSGEQTIDGVLTSTSRVLVKDQTAPEDNGIYVTAAGAWARATDMDAAGEVEATAVYVSGGATQGGMSFATYSVVTTLGTDAITFVQTGANSGVQDQIDLLAPLAVVGKDAYSFPRERDKYGMVYFPSNHTIAFSQVTFTGWNTLEIAAGSGNKYRAVLSSSHSFMEANAKIVVFIRVDSGGHSAPLLNLSSDDRGSEVITFAEELDGLYVAEMTTPASGFYSVTAILTSTDATNPVVCSKFMFAVARDAATSIRPRFETDALQAWYLGGQFEGPGNLWVVDKGTMDVAAADGPESVKANGITLDGDEEYIAFCYIENADGTPANVDRAYLRAASFIYEGTAQIIYLDPVADYPGVYAKRIITPTAGLPSLYCDLIIDNAKTVSTAYTEKAVKVKAVQLYKSAPGTFYPPELLTFRDPTEIHAHVYDGVMNVFTPTFTATGNKYLCWQPRRFDETGHAYGGGVGSSLEEIFYCRRTGPRSFQPIYDGTDVGLNGFAIKKDDAVADFVGGDVHGGQARRAVPQLLIDDVAVTHGTRADYVCTKVELREFYELYSAEDGTTVFAHVDTVQIWEGNIFKHKTTVTYQSAESIITDYTYMLSPKLYWDGEAAKGAVWETITLPDQSDATYTPGGGVDATYPSESHFQMADTTNGLNWDVEVQGAVPSTFRSWIQAGGSSRKLYIASKAITDSSGLDAEIGVPVSVSNGEVVSIEVWVTVTGD